MHGFTSELIQCYIIKYGAVHADFMFDHHPLSAPYKENRRFDIVPFAGIGEHLSAKVTSHLSNQCRYSARYRISKRLISMLKYRAILDDDM